MLELYSALQSDPFGSLDLFVSCLYSAKSKLQYGFAGCQRSNCKRFGLKLPVKVNDHVFE